MNDLRISSGLPGLDEILHGGSIPQSANLLRGGPGAGKTTFGFHFLTDGVQQKEESLFIALGEPVTNIQRNAGQPGFKIDKKSE